MPEELASTSTEPTEPSLESQLSEVSLPGGSTNEPTQPAEAPSQDAPLPDGQVPTEQTPTSKFFEYAKRQGYDLSSRFQSEEEAFAHIFGTLSRRDADAELGMRLRGKEEDWERFQKWQAEQLAQQVPKEQKAVFQRPEWDPEWSRELQVNPATGRLELKPGSMANPEIVQKAYMAIEAQKKFQNQLFWNTEEVLAPLIDKAVEQAEQRMLAQFSHRDTSAKVQQIISENRSWMTDGQTLTPQGRKYTEYVAMLDQAGVKDPVVTNQLALRLLAADTASPTPAPNPGVQTPAQNGFQHPSRIPSQAPGRGVTNPDDGRQLSLSEVLMRNAEREGVTSLGPTF